MTHIYNHSHGARIVQHDRNVFRIGLGEVEVIRLYDTSLLGETAQSWLPNFDRQRVAAMSTGWHQLITIRKAVAFRCRCTAGSYAPAATLC